MTIVQHLAHFVKNAMYNHLSDEAKKQLKIRILDSLGVAIGAFDGKPIKILQEHIKDFCKEGVCTLIGGGTTNPALAAMYNGALVRYLDYNDSYLAKGETCHPSDNLGAVLAAAEYANVSGNELLTALAVAYQVQCRLSDEAPVRAKGFDHTTQGAYAVAAGVSKALGMDEDKIAHAIAISATPLNALRVTRTGALSHWKGLAYPYMAFGATVSSFLAMRGITGPLEVFEGNKGFQEAIAGKFFIDWETENLERVRKTILKRFNAEIHSQSTLEGVLELKNRYLINPAEIENVKIETFDVAYHIIGGGEEGDKTLVRTKEEADHSLPYMTAVALLDGNVLPSQYRTERIVRNDVQTLLRKVKIQPNKEYSAAFPNAMPCSITIRLRNGQAYHVEKQDYEGFHTKPMSWDTIIRKFERFAAALPDKELPGKIIEMVKNIENYTVKDLTKLLSQVRQSWPG